MGVVFIGTCIVEYIVSSIESSVDNTYVVWLFHVSLMSNQTE